MQVRDTSSRVLHVDACAFVRVFHCGKAKGARPPEVCFPRLVPRLPMAVRKNGPLVSWQNIAGP